jgi:hypothetical protein
MVLRRHDFETVQAGIDKGVGGEFVFAEVAMSKIDGAASIGVIALRAGRRGREGDKFTKALRLGGRFSQAAGRWKHTARNGLKLMIGGTADVRGEGDSGGIKDETFF